MNHDDDAGEDLLAGVDLHKWQPPPPPVGQRAAVLVSALAPARPPKRRRNIAWSVAALVIANAAIAATLAFVLARPAPVTEPLAPAGGPTVDHFEKLLAKLEAERRELVRQLETKQRELQRLQDEQRELQRRLIELEDIATASEELEKKLRRKRDKPERPPAEHEDWPVHYEDVAVVAADSPAPVPGLPRDLDRAAISKGIQAIKPHVQACGERSGVKGKVRVKVRVVPDGRVAEVWIETTPDARLGACVANAVQKAKFEPTQLGGSFSYPFVF